VAWGTVTQMQAGPFAACALLEAARMPQDIAAGRAWSSVRSVGRDISAERREGGQGDGGGRVCKERCEMEVRHGKVTRIQHKMRTQRQSIQYETRLAGAHSCGTE